MTPATVEDAYSMLLEAVAIDDPVIFCEHKFLYYHLKAGKLADRSAARRQGPHRARRPRPDHRGLQRHGARSARSRDGTRDRRLGNRSRGFALRQTARHGHRHGVSVARTGRLLCVGEAWPWGGVTAEVIARVASEGFGLLDAPPQRLNAKDTPVPYHPNLWAAHRPTARSIAAAAANEKFKIKN